MLLPFIVEKDKEESMDDGVLISVVMPVYNVEKYLDRAVESVLSQTYRNLELILVDDCSPDGSGKKCDEWAERDNRVRAVHLEKNGGAGNARNRGIAIAAGCYIAFVDADDSLDKDAYTTIVKSIQHTPAQVVVFGIVEEYYNRRSELVRSKPFIIEDRVYLNSDELRARIITLESSTLYGYPVNKLYDLEYIRKNKILFPEIGLAEDLLFNADFFMHIETMRTLSIAPYHYAKRFGMGATWQYTPQYFNWHRLRVKKLLEQHQCWGICTEEVRRILGNIYFRYIFSALQRNCDKRSGMTAKDRRKWIESLYDDSLYGELSAYVQPESAVFRLMAGWLRKKRTTTVLATARLIFMVKGAMPMLFVRLKENR